MIVQIADNFFRGAETTNRGAEKGLEPPLVGGNVNSLFQQGRLFARKQTLHEVNCEAVPSKMEQVSQKQCSSDGHSCGRSEAPKDTSAPQTHPRPGMDNFSPAVFSSVPNQTHLPVISKEFGWTFLSVGDVFD